MASNSDSLGRLAVLVALPTLVLAGCGGSSQEDGVVDANTANQSVSAAPAIVPLSANTAEPALAVGHDRIERGVMPPAAEPRKGPMLVENAGRNFVDPPLPAELNDDGGLKPLPIHKR